MVKGVVFILICVRLLLVKGVDPNDLVNNNDEIANDSSKRILFGNPARVEDFPYLVRLRLGRGNALCSGSIIANHWIISAAHCIRNVNCSEIEIFPAVWQNRESVNASQCFYHDQYRTGNYEYDVSLLRVDPDILEDGRAKTVSLPPPGKLYPAGTPVVIAGWGRNENKEHPSALIRADVRLGDWETCNRMFIDNHFQCQENPNCQVRDIPIRVVCTKGEEPAPSGICYGDSGGPAVTEDGFLVGIACFVLNKNNFCKFGAPSMFTSVVDYLPWILNHVDPSVDTSQFTVLPEHILD